MQSAGARVQGPECRGKALGGVYAWPGSENEPFHINNTNQTPWLASSSVFCAKVALSRERRGRF